jgi:hypothetical protein
MLQKLLKLLPHKDIVKDGSLYLRRHYLTPRTWRYRVFLHLINREDNDRDPHSHPWKFWTLILWGGYFEVIFNTLDQIRGRQNPVVRFLGPFSFLFRPAEHIHMVYKLVKPTWTLVIAGPSKRVWGFYPVTGEFVPWYDYLRREDGTVPDQLPEDRVSSLT